MKKLVLLSILLGSFFTSKTQASLVELAFCAVCFSSIAYVYNTYNTSSESMHYEKHNDTVDEETQNHDIANDVKNEDILQQNQQQNDDNTITPQVSQAKQQNEDILQQNQQQNDDNAITPQVSQTCESVNLDEDHHNNEGNKQHALLLFVYSRSLFAGISGIIAVSVLGKIVFNWYKKYQEKRKIEQENADKEYNEIEQLLS